MNKLKQILIGLKLALKAIFGFKNKEAELIKYADATKRIVNIIRSVIENPLLDFAVELTKTDIDNKVLFILRESLRELQEILVNDAKNPNALITSLKRSNNALRDAMLSDIEKELLLRATDKAGIPLSPTDAEQWLAYVEENPNCV